MTLCFDGIIDRPAGGIRQINPGLSLVATAGEQVHSVFLKASFFLGA
jgi:hypothetical protein